MIFSAGTSVGPIQATAAAKPRNGDQVEIKDPLGRVPLIAFLVALAVLAIAYSFSRGRSVQAFSGPIYWSGQVVIYMVPAIAIFQKRRISTFEGLGIAIVLGVATYVIKLCYAVLTFTNSDEYQHLVTVDNILGTHHLFGANPTLPVSPFYPGLEVLTSAFANLTHLSVYASASVVVGAGHVVALVALFYLLKEITSSNFLASISILIYATGGEYPTFTSYFAYESLAFPLVLLSILAFVRMIKSETSSQSFLWGAVCVALTSATIVTHHASSIVLVGFAIVIAVFQIFSPEKRLKGRSYLAMGIVGGGFLGIWEVVIARPTFSYLGSALTRLLFNGHKAAKISTAILSPNTLKSLQGGVNPGNPPFEHFTGYAWGLAISGLLAVGIVSVFQRKTDRNSFIMAMAALSPLVYLSLGILILFGNGLGSQFGDRLSVYALIPGSLMCAIAIDRIKNWVNSKALSRPNRIARSLRVSTTILAAIIVVLGSVSLSFPTFHEHIPGPYIVGGTTRTYDLYDISAAEWASVNFPAENVIATDIVNSELMEGIARQYENAYVSENVILGNGPSPVVDSLLTNLNLQFVVADMRITSHAPIFGLSIFSNDPYAGHYSSAIPRSSLTKFNSVPGVSRVFDNGPIVIYDLKGSDYLPDGNS